MGNQESIALVFSVVDPQYPDSIQLQKIGQDRKLFPKAVKLAEKNGLYYYFIDRLRELNVELPLLDRKRWKEEGQKLSGFKETITLLNNMSQKSKIDYAVIKACTTIPHVPRDVDIFVSPGKKKETIEALENEGLKCVHSDNIETTLLKGEYIHLDVYTRICYFAVDCMDEQFLLDSLVKNEIFGMEYPGVSNEANFLLTILHSLFGHGSMTLLDFLHIRHSGKTLVTLSRLENTPMSIDGDMYLI